VYLDNLKNVKNFNLSKNMNYWGYHALFDCSECNIHLISDKENIRTFIKELVKEIDMVSFGEPMIEYFKTHDPNKSGISFFQMIETSNISGHMVESTSDAYIDIFSCKEFDTNTANKIIQKYFDPKKSRLNFITRQAG
jgi:S-adenosylmethionine/arginine decarboxylase-like enzyme